jgi:hypothetical protein
MKHTEKMILAAAALFLASPSAWADGTNNLCKLDDGTIKNVICSWPDDPSVHEPPSISDCQAYIRVPTSLSDDCGNSDFQSCMEGLGFQCSNDQQ